MASALLSSAIDFVISYLGDRKGFLYLLGPKLGIFGATTAVWLITLSSNTLMFIGLDPVVMDDLTTVPFHLVRWAEWQASRPPLQDHIFSSRLASKRRHNEPYTPPHIPPFRLRC